MTLLFVIALVLLGAAVALVVRAIALSRVDGTRRQIESTASTARCQPGGNWAPSLLARG